MVYTGTRMSVPRAAASRAAAFKSRQVTTPKVKLLERGLRDCACGAPARGHNHACDRCRFLDQPGRSASYVVSALRDARNMSLRDICETTSRSPRNVLRVLQRLLKIGRVERVEEEMDDCRAGMTRWLYRLTG